MNDKEYTELLDRETDRVLKRFGITRPRCGFWADLGWIPIVERAFEKMIAAGWDKDLQQVKQKFKQLRIYIGTSSVEIDKIISDAEIECDKTCELCGGERQDSGPGMGQALCETCESKGNKT